MGAVQPAPKEREIVKKIGLAGFLHETNTFSNTPTPLENFVNQSGFYPELMRGDEILQLASGRINISSSGFLQKAKSLGLEWSRFFGAELSLPSLCLRMFLIPSWAGSWMN